MIDAKQAQVPCVLQTGYSVRIAYFGILCVSDVDMVSNYLFSMVNEFEKLKTCLKRLSR